MKIDCAKPLDCATMSESDRVLVAAPRWVVRHEKEKKKKRKKNRGVAGADLGCDGGGKNEKKCITAITSGDMAGLGMQGIHENRLEYRNECAS